jgi:DNA-directed RNA polymerase subunit RPC12/RpoP
MSELKTDPLDHSCLGCDQVMFRKGLPGGNVNPGSAKGSGGAKLESDDADWYIVCPHCGAKNVVLSERSPQGLPLLRISHVKQ